MYLDSSLNWHLPGGESVTTWVGDPVESGGNIYTFEIRGSTTTRTTTTRINTGIVVSQPLSNYGSIGTLTETMNAWGEDITWGGPQMRTSNIPVTTKKPAKPGEPTKVPPEDAHAAHETTISETVVGASPNSASPTKAAEYVPGLTGWKPTRWMSRTAITVLVDDSVGVKTSVVTESDFAGRPTATHTSILVSGLPQDMHASVATLQDEKGSKTTVTMLVVSTPPAYVRASVITMRNEAGVATATITSTPPPISTPRTVVMTDGNGVPIATYVTSILATPRVVTYTDSQGVPTETATEYPVNPTDEPPAALGNVVKVYEVSKGAYFVGFFLPPIVSSLLTIPIRMIDLSAKQLQPWHELTRARGASADASLCLRTGGMHGLVSSFRSLAGGQVLVFLTTVLTLFSIVLVPLSSEAVALKLHGSCTETDFRGCAMTLGVFLGPAKATLVLLGCMVLLLALILLALRRWRSGVSANPWTIAGITSLSMNQDVRALFALLPSGIRGRIDHKKLVRALGGRTFKLGYFSDYPGVPEYGIVIHREVSSQPGPPRLATKLSMYIRRSRDAEKNGDGDDGRVATKHHLPFLMLSYTWRVVFLLFLTGVLAVILYYNSTGGDTPFERFMSTQSLGVRALFTLIGISIAFYWSSFFTSESSPPWL